MSVIAALLCGGPAIACSANAANRKAGGPPVSNLATTDSRIDSMELFLRSLDAPADTSLVHHFAPGVYAREFRVPAGTIGIGKVHKTEHLNVILAGSAVIWSEDGGAREVVAPCVFVSKPGARKIVYNADYLVWLTIHPTHETDLGKLEEELVETRNVEGAPSLDQLSGIFAALGGEVGS